MKENKEKIENNSDKLNMKRTFFIGMAFFSIMMLWQVYNYTIPLFLKDMNVGETKIGVIMGLDNLMALVLLPLFGILSDKTKSKLGKRMPYIIIGTILASATFPFIGVFGIKGAIIPLIIVICLVLVFMNIYRTPAVSLMPDVTPEKHRSLANGIINLMGGIGGILAYGLILFFFKGNTKLVPFVLTSVFMVIALVILLFTINENKLVAKKNELEKKEDENVVEVKETIETKKENKKKVNVKLLIILLAIFFWFFAVNAVETFWSVYSFKVFNLANEAVGASALLILTVSSIAMYIPAGIIGTKIGRGKTILLGIALIIIPFTIAGFIREWNLIALSGLFIVAGIGWATINVNSYPMVAQLANDGNTGKFTGYYYFASMLAQTLTPVLAGAMIQKFGNLILFPYSTVAMVVALVLMLVLVIKEHKKNKKNIQA